MNLSTFGLDKNSFADLINNDLNGPVGIANETRKEKTAVQNVAHRVKSVALMIFCAVASALYQIIHGVDQNSEALKNLTTLHAKRAFCSHKVFYVSVGKNSPTLVRNYVARAWKAL